MFDCEEGAQPILREAVDKYESFFKSEFPLYEYTDVTRDERYDFCIEGAKRLANFIDERIELDKPVSIPSDYEERLY